MRLVQFSDHLGGFCKVVKPVGFYEANGVSRLNAESMKEKDDLAYWGSFAERFFSRGGVLRYSTYSYSPTEKIREKQYEIASPAMPRYFHTHFESGVTNMQMIFEKGTEKELPLNGHYIESQNSSFVYWFEDGSHVSHKLIL